MSRSRTAIAATRFIAAPDPRRQAPKRARRPIPHPPLRAPRSARHAPPRPRRPPPSPAPRRASRSCSASVESAIGDRVVERLSGCGVGRRAAHRARLTFDEARRELRGVAGEAAAEEVGDRRAGGVVIDDRRRGASTSARSEGVGQRLRFARRREPECDERRAPLREPPGWPRDRAREPAALRVAPAPRDAAPWRRRARRRAPGLRVGLGALARDRTCRDRRARARGPPRSAQTARSPVRSAIAARRAAASHSPSGSSSAHAIARSLLVGDARGESASSARRAASTGARSASAAVARARSRRRSAIVGSRASSSASAARDAARRSWPSRSRRASASAASASQVRGGGGIPLPGKRLRAIVGTLEPELRSLDPRRDVTQEHRPRRIRPTASLEHGRRPTARAGRGLAQPRRAASRRRSPRRQASARPSLRRSSSAF